MSITDLRQELAGLPQVALDQLAWLCDGDWRRVVPSGQATFLVRNRPQATRILLPDAGRPRARRRPVPRPPLMAMANASRERRVQLSSRAGYQARRMGLSAVEVRKELERAFATVPGDGVVRHYCPRMMAVVDTDDIVLSVSNRQDVPPASRPSPSVRPTVKRKGKRGGIGRTKPSDYRDIYAVIRSAPGWDWRIVNNGHVQVTGPDGQKVQIAATPSDHRTTQNTWSQLRKLGLPI